MTARRALLALGLTLLLAPQGQSATPARSPVRVDVQLDRPACIRTPRGTTLGEDVALGLVAFNSPYLFGGKALRSDLTCGACHSPSGLSGAAVRLRFRAPVPDLAAVAGTNVATFVRHAVVAEFDGPLPPPEIVRGLAALVRVLAPISSTPSDSCRLGAADVVDIDLHLAIARIRRADPDELDFLIDSARFLLGEIARSAPDMRPDRVADANRTLHDLLPAIDKGQGAGALAALQQLADRWEAAPGQRRFGVATDAAVANE